jgi:hypothetical protein
MRNRGLWAVLAFSWFAVGLIYAAWPGRSTFTVGPETTYVTEPLDDAGYPDYVTALNDRLRNDITTEDNANVLIWQALGPHPSGATMSPEYFQWLGIESPSEEGTYLVSWTKYQKTHPKPDEGDDLDTLPDLSREEPSPWTAEERPRLADWLNKNEVPLALTIAASRRPRYYNPLVPKRIENLLKRPGIYTSS